jgi:glucuronosyltransferase
MNVFSKLKQRVILKWDEVDIDLKPKNVLIKNWIPQDDILAHKNCILFISHGGLGGVAESKYHGVPIVGIPL